MFPFDHPDSEQLSWTSLLVLQIQHKQSLSSISPPRCSKISNDKNHFQPFDFYRCKPPICRTSESTSTILIFSFYLRFESFSNCILCFPIFAYRCFQKCSSLYRASIRNTQGILHATSLPYGAVVAFAQLMS